MNNVAGMQKAAKTAMSAGIIFAFLSVAIGAFAAHGLKTVLNEYQLGIVDTAARYQMYHGVALILAGLFASMSNAKIRWVNITFILGVLCFSGSLYLLALLEIRWIAFITPIGGLFMLAAWLLFLRQIFISSLVFDCKKCGAEGAYRIEKAPPQ